VIALRFAAEGARLGIMDLDVDGCYQVTEEIAGGRAGHLPAADVSKGEQVTAAIQALAGRFGPPNLLVHNAAVMPSGTIDETTEEEWDQVFAVAVRGAYLTSRAIIPWMRRAGGGVILFMAPFPACRVCQTWQPIPPLKGALIALTALRPSTTPAKASGSMRFHRGRLTHPCSTAGSPPRATLRPRLGRSMRCTRGRVGTIEEVANVFTFLASDQASFVSGTNVMVDGAMSVKSEQPRL
jgi:NAD(P)-dependent dehydrogenase (short-subunit alcohol dehydrogenase family)